jgi:hypothetical protein
MFPDGFQFARADGFASFLPNSGDDLAGNTPLLSAAAHLLNSSRRRQLYQD